MSNFRVGKMDLLAPLAMVAGVVDRKQSKPVLANVCMRWDNHALMLTCSDLEIQTSVKVPCETSMAGGTTVGAKKFLEIIRSLDDEGDILFTIQDDTLRIKQGRSAFKLATLPVEQFPMRKIEETGEQRFIQRLPFVKALQSTVFSISLQDVRAFLNGLLLCVENEHLVMVGMDGHRMAVNRMALAEKFSERRLILPRKSVHDLLRLLQQIDDDEIRITLYTDHFVLTTAQYHWDSKLIDARFPAYQRVIPQQQDKFIYVDRDQFKRALARTMILANERFKAVVLSWQQGELHLVAYNQEQEEALEVLSADVTGENMKIGINANYLLDGLNHLPEGMVCLSFATSDSSILVQSANDKNFQYIIMPMKL
ncbi:MAG: Beta sliding clamp [Pseudomonadota bacterium]|nr:Beta sliding clamp [Pseudomonadota bacterium]